MRLLGFLILLGGLFAAFGDRVTGTPFGEFQIGRYNTLSAAHQYAPVSVYLEEKDAPIGVSLEVGIREGAYDAGGQSDLTMKVTNADGAVSDQIVPVSAQTAYHREDGTMLVENALTIDPVTTGQYTFTLGDGTRDDLGVRAVVLNLKGHQGAFSYNIQPIGYALIALGGVMFIAGGRRRRRAQAIVQQGRAASSKTSSIGYRQPEAEPAPQPEPKKTGPSITWGRDGDKD